MNYFVVKVVDDDDIEYIVEGYYSYTPARYYDRYGDPGNPSESELEVEMITREDGYVLSKSEKSYFEDRYYQQIWDQISLEYGG